MARLDSWWWITFFIVLQILSLVMLAIHNAEMSSSTSLLDERVGGWDYETAIRVFKSLEEKGVLQQYANMYTKGYDFAVPITGAAMFASLLSKFWPNKNFYLLGFLLLVLDSLENIFIYNFIQLYIANNFKVIKSLARFGNFVTRMKFLSIAINIILVIVGAVKTASTHFTKNKRQ
ncbi:pyridoxine/pyridoxamine 5'- phosphate oxidase [Acrasis kona]|uniref:Pyridoxine/pyridoxamine 5'- phosphate oxidase n=1 Tax=Acrasis kona TaxID=1008807 RepID=A0AAW2Z0Z8_9EUKA